MPVPTSRIPFQLTPAGRPQTFLVLLLVVLAMTGAAMHRGTPAHPTADGAEDAPEEALGPEEDANPFVLDAAMVSVLVATLALAAVVVWVRRPRPQK